MSLLESTLFTREYKRFITTADKYFGGACLFYLAVAIFAYLNGAASVQSPLMIAGIIAFNVSISQLIIRLKSISYFKAELLFRQIPMAIICPVVCFNMSQALDPWWPIYLIGSMSGIIAASLSVKNLNFARVILAIWIADLLLANLFLGSPSNWYQVAYLVGTMVMIGFIATDWMSSAKMSLERESKRVEEIRLTNLQLNKAQKMARMGVSSLILASKELYVSDEMREIFELDPGPALPTVEEFFHIVHPDDREGLQAKYQIALTTGEAFEHEYRIITRSLKTLNIHLRLNVEKDSQGRLIKAIGVAHDITSRKTSALVIEQQRMQLVSASKLSALGEMAGGIAHEINTPLGAILLNADMIAEEGENLGSAEIVRHANSVISISKRIAKIVSGLKLFSRNGEADVFSEVNLNQLIEDTLVFCQEKFNYHGINVVIDGTDLNLSVFGNLTQLSQTLLNLLNNSFDAISSLQQKWIRLELSKDGGGVSLSVTDSGPGISAADVENIFNPFFTTKEIGKGTGLGLSISLGIMKSHGGTLQYDSSCPNTKFVMRFEAQGKSKAA